jgi:hypothetical protein
VAGLARHEVAAAVAGVVGVEAVGERLAVVGARTATRRPTPPRRDRGRGRAGRAPRYPSPGPRPGPPPRGPRCRPRGRQRASRGASRSRSRRGRRLGCRRPSPGRAPAARARR